ncbi:MAG: hypothetical protein ACI38Y_06400 [Candidatus Methanomethylophilaceae archaeon]
MTCPRCGSSDIVPISDYVEDEVCGTCIVSHGLCQTCRFEVINIAWLGEDDKVQYLGWMTDMDVPKDVPKAVRERVEEHRKSA